MSNNHCDTPNQKLAAAWKWTADISPGNRPEAEKFLRLKFGQGAKSGTLALYALALRHLDHAIQGKQWKALEPDDATLFLSTLRLQGMSHDSIQAHASYCKAFLKWAMDVPQLPSRLQFAFRVLGNHKLPGLGRSAAVTGVVVLVAVVLAIVAVTAACGKASDAKCRLGALPLD